MKKHPDINIYTGNHGKMDGIEDYLSIFKDLLYKKNQFFEISNKYMHGTPNIVIDEFTNYLENRKLAEFKKNNPDTPLILVLTEFMQSKWGVRALNHFSGIENSALICLINIFLLYRRKDFPNPSMKDWVLLVIFMPVLLIIGIAHGIQYVFFRLFSRARADRKKSTFNAKIHQLIYWGLRYHALIKNLPYFDYVISSHEKIWPQMIQTGVINKNDKRHLGVIYPQFDINHVLNHLFVDKENKIEITGTISLYRRKWTDKVNFYILSHGLHNTIGMVQHIKWGATSQEARAAFSLHPPQTRQWPYSSPTRIYRALQVDGNLPVITKHFGQNPIEDVCLVYDGVGTLVQMIEYWENPEAARHFIVQKMEKYNAIAAQRNDSVVEKILASKSV